MIISVSLSITCINNILAGTWFLWQILVTIAIWNSVVKIVQENWPVSVTHVYVPRTHFPAFWKLLMHSQIDGTLPKGWSISLFDKIVIDVTFQKLN